MASQITERDRQLLEMLAEHRVLIAEQLARHLGVSDGAAGARLRRLARLRLLEHARIFQGQPASVAITTRGLGLVGSPLPAPTRKLGAYRHDVGVGWVWLAARGGAFGQLRTLHTERSMRSADLRDDGERQRFGVATGGLDARGRRARHYPDLLVERADGARLAIELELSAKGRGRLERIMRGYAGEGSITAVLYLVADARLESWVSAAARRAGAAEVVVVKRLSAASLATLALGGEARNAVQRGAARTELRQPAVPGARHGAAEAGR